MQEGAWKPPHIRAESVEGVYPTEGVVFVRGGEKGPEVLLVKGAGDAWYFPGGKRREHETTPEALIREIREELGVALPEEALAQALKETGEVSYYRIQHAHHVRDHVIKNYLVDDPALVARLAHATPQPGDTVTELRWVPLSELATPEWETRLTIPTKRTLRTLRDKEKRPSA